MAFKAFTLSTMPREPAQLSADNSGYTAINPATGKRERIVSIPVMGSDGGFEGEQQGWESENVGALGPHGVPASPTGIDHPDTGSDWKDMFSNFKEAAAGAALAYGGATMLGAGAAGGMAGAGGAFEMGAGGVAEAMGLGGGYSTPALAGAAGGADMTGFISPSDPFAVTRDPSLGFDLGGAETGDFTSRMLPGGDLFNTGGGIGGSSVGGVPGVSATGIFEAATSLGIPPGIAQKAAELAKAGTPAAQIASALGIPESVISALGRALPGLISAVGSNAQSNSLADLANKYAEFGAPSRARYEASFAPGFSMANDPAYKDSLDQTMKSFLHKASIQGNPADSPNAWAQTLKDVNSQFAMPALNEYRRTNMAGGGLASLNAAMPGFDTSVIGADANTGKFLGEAAGNVFNPPSNNSLEQLMKIIRGSGMNFGTA